jgi:AraC family transcriptional regulator of arabinose operon
MPSGRSKVPRFGPRRNIGAYEKPFSGVGMEFDPPGVAPGETGIVLHEAGYWPNNHWWNFPAHFSPFWRVYYDYKRGHAVGFGDREIPLGPDRLVVIPNHQRFDSRGNPPVPSLWMHFTCRRNADPRQPMPIVIPLNATLAAFVRDFPPAFRSRREDKRDVVYRYSVAFLLYVLNQPQIRWQAPVPERIANVVRLINEQPGRTWSNPELAREAWMSADGFVRAFRRWMNRTPNRYLAEVRIREACRRLTGGDDSIERIAETLGYTNRYYFTRVFKRHTGTTPGRYRRWKNPGAGHPGVR